MKGRGVWGQKVVKNRMYKEERKLWGESKGMILIKVQ